MPKEETEEFRRVRDVVGDKTDLAKSGYEVSLTSMLKSQVIRGFGSPSLIHDLGAFGLDKTITLEAGEDDVIGIVADSKYLYAGTMTSPGKIVRIDLNSFTRESALTLDAGEDSVSYLVIHGDYIYAGLVTSPAKIVKINRLSFTREAVLTLDAGEDLVYQLAIDGSYLYAGLHTTPGKIVRIDLDTFTKVSTLTFAAGLDKVDSVLVDRGFLYVGLETSPGAIAQVDLKTFSVWSSLDLPAGEDYVFQLGSDGVYIYAGLTTSPGKVVKIAYDPVHGTLSRVKSITLPVGYDQVRGLVFNGIHIIAGLYTQPAKHVYIDQSTFEPEYANTFPAGHDRFHNLYTDGIYVYSPHFVSPAKISRTYVMPTINIFQKAVSSVHEQVHSGTRYVYPSLTGGVTLTAGNAAAWTMGSYVEIVPADTVLTTFYLDGIVVDDTASQKYEIDIATGLAGSETIIASRAVPTGYTGLIDINPPIKIPSYTRVAARCATDSGLADTCTVKLHFMV